MLQDAGFDSPHVELQRHGEIDSAIVYAQRKARIGGAAGSQPAEDERRAESPPLHIDVKTLIAESSIEELNRTAEEYFASLTEWEDHLAKPFARAEDTPQLLINLGVLIQGLNLTPGMTVLEYGAGTGWLSRFLTQLGCRTILLDVSPTALKIARELFQRLPPIGARPEPEFLVFDGRHIELADASVDRVVCFDAFHHATNPDEMLREFGRVLKPGGIAGFAEPGPQHSKTAQSQFEMRTYGVIENDVDIHAIGAAAQRYGFSDLKLAAFNVAPFHVSLAEFDDLLAAGETYARWAELTRAFLGNVRDFFLTKAGTEEIDSRHPAGLKASVEATLEGNRVRATVRNLGRAKWLPSNEPYGGVTLGAHLVRHGRTPDPPRLRLAAARPRARAAGRDDDHVRSPAARARPLRRRARLCGEQSRVVRAARLDAGAARSRRHLIVYSPLATRCPPERTGAAVAAGSRSLPLSFCSSAQ